MDFDIAVKIANPKFRVRIVEDLDSDDYVKRFHWYIIDEHGDEFATCTQSIRGFEETKEAVNKFFRRLGLYYYVVEADD